MGRARRAREAARRGETPGDQFRVPPELTQQHQTLFVEATPGAHRWAVIQVHELSYDEALDAHRDNARVLLGRRTLRSVQGPLCLICEEPFAKVHARPCSGDPTLTGPDRRAATI